MTDEALKKPAVVLILPPDGKFHSPDIWSILHKQEGGFDLFVIDHCGGAAKILPAMAKAAKRMLAGGGETLGAQLNRLAREMENPLFAFLTDRVLPVHGQWLNRLLAPMKSGAAVASFGRSISSPGGNYFIIEDLRKRYPLHGNSAAFTIDNCAIRRSLILEKPFPERACNDPAAVWLKQTGTAAAYAPDAVVMRDTLLPLKEVYANSFAEGEDLARAGGDVPFSSAAAAVARDLAEDLRFCFSRKKPQYLWYPFLYRAAIHWGLYKGGKTAR